MASRNVTVPRCAAHVSASEYSSIAKENFELTSWDYYKTYVTSAQILPGLIFGVLCWIVAVFFVVWLLTLCCRSVGWRSRRTRVHDMPVQGRNRWAIFNIFMFLIVLGVVGTGTWALVEGLRSTDGQVNELWTIVADAKTEIVEVSTTVQDSSTSIQQLEASDSATYTLVNNNQVALTALGINVPATLSLLQSFANTLANGRSATQEADANLQANAIVKIEDLQNNYQKRTEDAWSIYRRIAVAVFFGLVILFGVVAGVLALLDRTPRLTATATLFLWIWTGFVLLLGAGLLNVVWRVSRDSCLYGVDYAADKIGGGGGTQVVLDYYFGRTSIPPQDVSQRLFGFNLTEIIDTLSDTTLTDLVSQLQSPGGQLLVSTATADDRAAINGLGDRLGYLGSNLSALNSEIQASNFNGLVTSTKTLICCSTTSALWNLWLASVITGAVAMLLGVLTLIKVMTAIHSLENNQHYTPHNPNGTIREGKHAQVL